MNADGEVMKMTTEWPNMCSRRSLSVSLLLLLFLLPTGSLLGQEEEREIGRIDIGVRGIFGDHESSKFQEYRALPEGLFLRYFRADLGQFADSNVFVDIQARQTLENNQDFLLSAGAYGTHRLEFRFDETPHNFTNTASSFYSESSTGFFSVPPEIRSALEANPSTLPGFLAAAPGIDVDMGRRRVGGSYAFAPNRDWNLEVEYWNNKQTGGRAFGTNFGFGRILEFTEPIDYRTQQVRATLQYASRKWGVQVNYAGSTFRNNTSEMTWQNPFNSTDALGNPAHGRNDLFPENEAYNLAIAGNYNFSRSTRVIFSVAPGWMRQNDRFIPFTVNTAVRGVPALPGSDLNGKKQTLAINTTLTSRLSRSVSVKARYRSYDYDNDGSSFIFEDYVRTDENLVGVVRRNLAYAYDRRNLALDASWRFLGANSAKFTYEYERLDRDHRDVEKSTENSIGAAVDLNPSRRVLLRASYKHSERDPEHYEANEESFPLGDPGLGQLDALRKFDEAYRDRDRAEVLFQLTPADAFDVSFSYGTTRDDYGQSDYGLLGDTNYSATIDLSYSPSPDWFAYAEYTRDNYDYDQRSRQRTSTNDSANNDWATDIQDRINTYGAGLTGSFASGRVTFDAFYTLSDATGSIRTRALGMPGAPNFLVRTAEDYPNTTARFHQAVGSIRFEVTENLYPRIEYRYENYSRADFQIDGIAPYMGNVDPSTSTSIFLGAEVPAPGYNAHVIAAILEYRF